MSQPCPYCGNLDFEEEDGLLVCTSCGRQQEGGLRVVDDEVEFGTQGKLNRRKIEKKKVKVTKIYRGARAYKLYLQAWQHIMWRQSYALIHGSTRMPPELWTVARDLWTLKLSTLVNRLDSQPQATSGEDGTDTADGEFSATEAFQAGEKPKTNLAPKLWDTISLIYLSALLIRHPISLSHIYNLIRSEELPFIRAVRFVPYEMTSHLPSEYQLALDTLTVPERYELQQTTFQFIQSFASEFDMEIPPLNWRILLYEWIVELGMPLEVYNTVKALSKILNYDFAYQLLSEIPSDPDERPKKRRRRTPTAMPELQLMSLIVVATKLLFPFPISPVFKPPHEDYNSQTLPEESARSSLTDLSLDWSAWHTLHHSNTPPQSLAQKHIETTDKDVSNMSAEEIDEYMSWYERTFTTPDPILRQKKTDLEMSILDMFPDPSLSGTTLTTTSSTPDPSDMSAKVSLCKQIQTSALQYKPAANSPDSVPPYPIFPSIGTLQSTDELFRENNEGKSSGNPIVFFHELAAKVACSDLKRLVGAVRYTERQMEKWTERRHREEMGRET